MKSKFMAHNNLPPLSTKNMAQYWAYISLFIAIMPQNVHQCSVEVRNIVLPHVCSRDRSIMLSGDELNLDTSCTYKVYWSLCMKLRRRNAIEKEEYSKENTFRTKKIRASVEEVLQKEVHQLKYRRKIRELIDRERIQRIMPLTHAILDAAIDNDEFEAKDMDYLYQNHSEIAVNIGFILSQVTNTISK